MFRFIRNFLAALPSILAGVFIIVMIWLFLVFPRAVNLLADLLGNMGTPLIPREQLIHTVVALIASLFPLYFLIVRPFRQLKDLSDGQGLSVRQGQGVAYIDTESARHQIYKAVVAIGGIKHTEVSVDSRDGRAVVLLNLTTENSINAGRKKQEVRREIKKVLEDQLGVQLAGEPTINFRLAEVYSDIPHPTEPVAAVEAPRARALPTTPSPPPVSTTTVIDPPPASSSASPIVGRRAMMPTSEPSPAPVIITPAPLEVETLPVSVSEPSASSDSIDLEILPTETATTHSETHTHANWTETPSNTSTSTSETGSNDNQN
jgi:hypothetical protein